MKINKIIALSVTLFTVLSSIYAYRFIDEFSSSSTQDFANFGTYISGILMPLFTLLSAVFLGLQIAKNSEAVKLERLIGIHKEHLSIFSKLLDAIDIDSVKSADNAAIKAYLNGDIVLNSAAREFYLSNSRTIEAFSVVSSTLQEIRSTAPDQYNIYRSSILAVTPRDKASMIEKLKFLLDNYRYNTDAQDFKWIYSESKDLFI